MNVLPPDSNWPEYYFNKLIDRGDCNSLTLPNNKAEVIDYLKIWNRTSLNNGSTIDLIDYEQLIYYELTYKDDEDIQLLISILKEKIANNYKLKSLLLDNLIDADLYKDNGAFCSGEGKLAEIWN